MDLCCFNRPFDDQSLPRIYLETEAKLFVQNMVMNGKIELGWSYMLDYENSANPDQDVKDSIGRWRKMAVRMTEETDALISTANRYQKLGVGTKDALHLACAAALRADCFITVDKGIVKKRDLIGELPIVNPLEFIQNQEAR
jgi:hypothetical protein